MTETVPIGGGLELIDLALFIRPYQTLAIADVHLGYEEILREEGTLIPRGHLDHLLARMKGIIEELNVTSRSPLKRLIINGDVCHPFDRLRAGGWRDLKDFLKRLGEVSEKIVLLEGNHDRGLRAALSWLGRGKVEVHSSYKLGEVLFLHGDREPKALPNGIKTLVIGHEHPAVGLKDRVTGRVERYKCFLVGEYRGRRLIVQPSFNPWVEGSDLTRESCLSPLLDEGRLEGFEVYPVSDGGKVYRFGPLGGLMGKGRSSGRGMWSVLRFEV